MVTLPTEQNKKVHVYMHKFSCLVMCTYILYSYAFCQFYHSVKCLHTENLPGTMINIIYIIYVISIVLCCSLTFTYSFGLE